MGNAPRVAKAAGDVNVAYFASANPATLGSAAGSSILVPVGIQIKMAEEEINAAGGTYIEAGEGKKINAHLLNLLPDFVNLNWSAKHIAKNLKKQALKTATEKINELSLTAVFYAGRSDRAIPLKEVTDAHNVIFGNPVAGTAALTTLNGLHFRNRDTTDLQGVATAQFARNDLYKEFGDPEQYQNVTIISHSDAFAKGIWTSFVNEWESLGGSVVSIQEHVGETAQGVFESQIVTGVKPDTEFVYGVWDQGSAKNFIEAFAKVDPNPNVKVLFAGDVSAVDYTTLSDAAKAFMSTRVIGLLPALDQGRLQYKKWLRETERFLSDGIESDLRDELIAAMHAYASPADVVDAGTEGRFYIHYQPRAYDVMIMFALAMTKAGTDDTWDIMANLNSVTNPAGKIFGPGQYASARKHILDGKEINYQGASGPVDLDEYHELQTISFDLWKVDLGGNVFFL